MAAAPSYKICIIKEGYSFMQNGVMRANGSCTLLKGKYNIIVDTLSPWDRNTLTAGLADYGISCDDIHYVICTHGHVDHIGNLNLFTRATQIVGFSISKGDSYHIHPFEAGEPYKIDDHVEVIATPGHTGTDIYRGPLWLLYRFRSNGQTNGDLFERQEDIDDPSLWRDIAGSENPSLQEQNRKRILNLANHIVPGHGKMFKVTAKMIETLNNDDSAYLGRSTPDGQAAP